MLRILWFYSILQNIVGYGIIAMPCVSLIHEEPEVNASEWSQASDCWSTVMCLLYCISSQAFGAELPISLHQFTSSLPSLVPALCLVTLLKKWSAYQHPIFQHIHCNGALVLVPNSPQPRSIATLSPLFASPLGALFWGFEFILYIEDDWRNSWTSLSFMESCLETLECT